MTSIVGCVEKGVVYIGGDSAGVGGLSLTIRKDRKVFRNGDFLIGGTSSFRMLQLLHHAFVPPVYDPAIDVEKFMVTTFVDAIRQCFKGGGYATKDSEQESGGDFLVGFRGRLWHIGNDYQVGESLSGYDAAGCGLDIARGVLYATPDMQSEKRLELALRASEAHSAGVRAPFYIESLEPDWVTDSTTETEQKPVEALQEPNNVHIITKWHRDEAEAKRQAEQEYDHFFQVLRPSLVVVKKNISILRELRATEGLVGYHIRTECEPESGEKS